MSVLYNQLDRQGEEFQRLFKLGRAGTEVAKRGRRAFGPKTRYIQKRARVSLERAQAAAGRDPADSAMVLATLEGGPIFDRDSNRFKDSLVRVRSAARHDRKRAQMARDAELQELADCIGPESGAAVRGKALLGDMGLREASDALQASPSRGLAVFDVVFNTGADAKAVAQWAGEHSRTSNLALALDNDWLRKTRTLMQADEKPLGKVPGLLPSCLASGFCVCTEDGRRIRAIRNRILNHLREWCRAGTPARTRLCEGEFVLRLHGAMKEPAVGDLWAALVAEQMPDEETALTGVQWWHVGMQYLKPFRPTFHVLREKVSHRATADRVILQGTGQFLVEGEACAMLHRRATWTSTLYDIVQTSERLWDFEPGEVAVQVCRRVGQHVWPLRMPRLPVVAGAAGAAPDAAGAPAEDEHPGGEDADADLPEADLGDVADEAQEEDEAVEVHADAELLVLAKDSPIVELPEPETPAPEAPEDGRPGSSGGAIAPVPRVYVGKALHLAVPGGDIIYYSRGYVAAVCRRGHGRYILTRGAHGG